MQVECKKGVQVQFVSENAWDTSRRLDAIRQGLGDGAGVSWGVQMGSIQ